tara:strand:+ start:359 stop:562 length:204 start_codon:yes stop_codon:yes gene_type:complete
MEDILRNSKILKENCITILANNGRDDLIDYIPSNKISKDDTIEEIISILAKSGRPVEINYIESFISK